MHLHISQTFLLKLVQVQGQKRDLLREVRRILFLRVKPETRLEQWNAFNHLPRINNWSFDWTWLSSLKKILFKINTFCLMFSTIFGHIYRIRSRNWITNRTRSIKHLITTTSNVLKSKKCWMMFLQSKNKNNEALLYLNVNFNELFSFWCINIYSICKIRKQICKRSRKHINCVN